jgi:hypothetical protein
VREGTTRLDSAYSRWLPLKLVKHCSTLKIHTVGNSRSNNGSSRPPPLKFHRTGKGSPHNRLIMLGRMGNHGRFQHGQILCDSSSSSIITYEFHIQIPRTNMCKAIDHVLWYTRLHHYFYLLFHGILFPCIEWCYLLIANCPQSGPISCERYSLQINFPLVSQGCTGRGSETLAVSLAPRSLWCNKGTCRHSHVRRWK